MKNHRHVRDAAIHRIEPLQKERTDGDLSEARKLWKQETAYHQRSKAETAMYRYKTIFGGAVRARKFENLTKELCLNGATLAKMTRLGISSTLTIPATVMAQKNAQNTAQTAMKVKNGTVFRGGRVI